MDTESLPRRCPRCGSDVPFAEVEGLCPACLLASVDTPLSGEASSDLSGFASSGPVDRDTPRLRAGQVFGRYRIERLLGRGGMGEVYAAQQLDTGRRVALKVLTERLADAQDRARFLREGQLAASVSHPNSVYIFGSEEIDGVPVITMELLPGGTLKDRVKAQGPLPPAEAVDAILQILAGLDAAHAAGILHRDVKPGNCFIDADGTRKIGDFGLSISTLARDVTQSAAHGGFRGTPQFASPEQLRGAPLDVRADIYAAGATLYYLLTGQAPFDERDLMVLVARASTESARSPRDLQPHIPRGLARVVLRCLAKDPASRPASYAAFTTMLQPYASKASAPASLGSRFVAGLIDSALLMVVHSVALSVFLFWRAPFGWISPLSAAGPSWLHLLLAVAYFGVLEGVWGASLGKRFCGLRVIRVDNEPRIGVRAFARAVLYYAPNALWQIPVIANPSSDPTLMGFVISLAPLLLMAALFVTARRYNGFAGLHDLATATRVVERTPLGSESRLTSSTTPLVLTAEPARRCGPFDVVGSIGSTESGRLLVAFDPALRRDVWIHDVPIGTPPVPTDRRDVSRPGRLRWLAGTRTSSEAWDAYEALDGAPLAQRLDGPLSSWNVVNRWLHGLAWELETADSAGANPSLTAGRVWITSANAAKLLDFELRDWPGRVGGSRTSEPQPARAPQAFLAWVGATALGEAGDPEYWPTYRRVPLSARSFLVRLGQNGFATMKDAATECRRLLTVPDRVTRLRRTAHVGFAAMSVVAALLLAALTAPMMDRVEESGLHDLSYFLYLIKQRDDGKPVSFLTAEKQDALEIYVAGRFRTMLSDDGIWDSPVAARLRTKRATAERVLAQRPTVSSAELAAATELLKDFIADRKDTEDPTMAWWEIVVTVAGLALTIAVLPAILSSSVTPGGLVLSAMGMAVVGYTGREVSRLRSFWRATIAWSPILVLLAIQVAFYTSMFMSITGSEIDFSSRSNRVFSWLLDHVSMEWTALVALTVFTLGAIAAILTPARGLQDRIAGTWLVPK